MRSASLFRTGTVFLMVMWPSLAGPSALVSRACAQEHGAGHGAEAGGQPVPGDAHAGDAHAGDAHGRDEKTAPNLFTGDIGNIFWSLVTFGAVILVLGKFAWKPILTALQKREDFIRESLARAKTDRDAAEARLRELEAQLASARDQATEIIEEGKRDAEAVRRRIESEARAEAEAATERAKREIELARDSAIDEIYKLTADLATLTAGKILRKEITPADHESLVAESIKELAQRS